MKRYCTMLLLVLGSMLVQAQPQDPAFQLFIVKLELSGEVKLAWTKPQMMAGQYTYELYRAMVSDSSAFTLIASTNDNYFVDKVPSVVTNISNTYAYYVLAKSGGTTIKSNIQLLPVPVLPPIGAFRLEGKIDSGKIKLAWQKPAVENISHYIVHGGHAAIAAPMLPRIDSTTNQWSVTDAPVPINPNEPVPLAFYIVAKLTTGEILTSTMLQLTLQPRFNRDNVKFVSVPPTFGQVNKKVEYKATAISSDPTAVLRYFVEMRSNAPVFSFKIDSVTGVVDWTPQAKGWYQFTIVARSDKGGMAKQEMVIGIGGGNGIIQGKVTDTLNAPIANAVIEVFKTENSLVASFAYAVKTDENGNYKINRVDPGSYKLRANSPSGKYQSQWYDGKREPSLADVITVQDSPAVTIANFKLRGGPDNLPKLTVTGTVKDTLGLPINGDNTRVIFVRAEFALNVGPGPNIFGDNFRKYFEFNPRGDFRLEGNSEFVFKAKVDSLGNYSVNLPPGGYIAFARSKGYSTEFYLETPDLLSATVIKVGENLSGINFTLAPLPPIALGEIKGAVLDSVNDIPVPARVIAFRDGWRFKDNHRISRVYVTDTDSTGAYSFSELLPGTYMVMAVPLGNYAPAFYTENDSITFRWKRAAKIVINGNSIDNIVIYVKQIGAFANGYTNITGTVNFNGMGNGMINGMNKAGGIVYAYRNGEISGYAMTDMNGKYFIDGLAPGQYTVLVDKPGFNESGTVSVSAGYDITGSPLSGSADFTLNSTTSVTVDQTIVPKEFVLEQNYPNPFNPSTTIRYSMPTAGNVSLKVFDILGKEVATLVNGYQQTGKYSVTFNALNLSSGMYFYRLETGSVKEVKKMILMK